MLVLLDALSSGTPRAEQALDWEHLRWGQQDLGWQYSRLSETEKATFRKAFLTSFRNAFAGRTFSAAQDKFSWRTAGPRPGCSGGGMSIEFERGRDGLKIVRLDL